MKYTDPDNKKEDEKSFSTICDQYKDALDKMTKDKNDMTIQINEMSDRSKIVEADLKKELEDNQEVIRTYKEKSEKQELELTELKSKIAVLKVDLEDEKKVRSVYDMFCKIGSSIFYIKHYLSE